MKNPRNFMLLVTIIWVSAVASQRVGFIIFALILTLISLPVWSYYTARNYGLDAKKWLKLSILIPFGAPVALAIKIGNIDKEKAGAGFAPVSSPPFNTYENGEWNVRFKYPYSWKITMRNETAGSWHIPVAVDGPVKYSFAPSFMINVHRYEILQGSPSMKVFQTYSDGSVSECPWNPEEYNKMTIPKVSEAFPGFRLVESEEIRAAGRFPAAREVYSYRDSRGGVLEESITVFCKGATFQFIFNAPAEGYAYYKGIFKGILDSIAITFDPYEIPQENYGEGKNIPVYGANPTDDYFKSVFSCENPPPVIRTQTGNPNSKRNNILLWGATGLIVLIIIIVSFANQGGGDKEDDSSSSRSTHRPQAVSQQEDEAAGPQYLSGMPGSSPGNLVNGGNVCDNMIMFYFAMSDGLHVTDSEGRFSSVITGDSVRSINVIEKNVYYISKDDNRIYRLSYDYVNYKGGKPKAVSDLAVQEMAVSDGWIFYIPEDGKGIYRMNTDGSGNSRLSKDKAKCLNIYYDSIKYVNMSDSSRIYEINLDGSGRKRLSDAQALIMILDNENALFIDKSNEKLYSLNVHTGKKVRLADDAVSVFNASNQRIVYKTKKDGNIVSINETGGNRETLLEGCDADWLGLNYNYLLYPDGKKIIGYRLDGSGTAFELGMPQNN